MSKLPVDVHLAKFLLIATIFRCLDAALTISSVLSLRPLFQAPMGLDAEANRCKRHFMSGRHISEILWKAVITLRL